AAGDFNNDGRVDFVYGEGASLSTYLNTSTGPGVISFSANTVKDVTYRCTGIQCVDVDGDGITDILATQGLADRAISVRNTTSPGSSTFTFEALEPWSSNGTFPYRCQLADFDK